MLKVILLLVFIYQATPQFTPLDNSKEATPGKKHEQINRYKNEDIKVIDQRTKKETILKNTVYCGMAYEQKDGKHWKVYVAKVNGYSQSFDSRAEALAWFTAYCPAT